MMSRIVVISKFKANLSLQLKALSNRCSNRNGAPLQSLSESPDSGAFQAGRGMSAIFMVCGVWVKDERTIFGPLVGAF
jgi:hypothetical protein